MKAGVPTIIDYEKSLNEINFKKMEEYSTHFIRTHSDALSRYPWSKDPLHAWSRQWEYPYVYDRINSFIKEKNEMPKIFDAGSGVTFFPYFIANQFNSEVHCYDYDQSYHSIFQNINENFQDKIFFHEGDIGAIPMEDETYDIVYCISVLEHTENYDSIIKEFKRILKPNGIFIVTFDIALDGDYEIPPEEADKLFALLNKEFSPMDFNLANHQDFVEAVNYREHILTTNYMKKNPSSLPWDPSSPGFRDLTIACYTFNKN